MLKLTIRDSEMVFIETWIQSFKFKIQTSDNTSKIINKINMVIIFRYRGISLKPEYPQDSDKQTKGDTH